LINPADVRGGAIRNSDDRILMVDQPETDLTGQMNLKT
jgi:hypothetical protein